MLRNRSTKIVVTLGPASSDPDMIFNLHQAGADLFRLNFSHGDHKDHKDRLTAIRALEVDTGASIGVLADLQGPKFRIGVIEGGATELQASQAYRFDLEDQPGDGRRAQLAHPEVFAALEEGMDLLIDDGRLRLTVSKCGADYADCRVVMGGRLSNRKGVNLPHVLLPMGAMTAKDQADLRFALDAGIDWVALSFVQRPDDIAEARRLIAGRAAIMAKIEKPAALHQIDEIIELADAIMVARGDLGVELPVEQVPALQKDLIRRARRAGKPVVVATQMLESMVAAPVPTRAEVSDVATAVYDGTDAVMLSGETAAGTYPRQAVEVMSRVAAKVESDHGYRSIMDGQHADPEATSADAITAAARQVAVTISASAIVTYTTSGSTALRAARERPPVPILVLTPRRITARRLSVAWGLSCVHSVDASSFTDMVDLACRAAVDRGVATTGDRLVITAGVPFGTPGATNSLRIAWIP